MQHILLRSAEPDPGGEFEFRRHFQRYLTARPWQAVHHSGGQQPVAATVGQRVFDAQILHLRCRIRGGDSCSFQESGQKCGHVAFRRIFCPKHAYSGIEPVNPSFSVAVAGDPCRFCVAGDIARIQQFGSGELHVDPAVTANEESVFRTVPDVIRRKVDSGVNSFESDAEQFVEPLGYAVFFIVIAGHHIGHHDAAVCRETPDCGTLLRAQVFGGDQNERTIAREIVVGQFGVRQDVDPVPCVAQTRKDIQTVVDAVIPAGAVGFHREQHVALRH